MSPLLNDRIVGVVAGFPVRHADRLSRRFVSMTLRRLPPWRLPGTFKHLRAAGNVSPHPPLDAFYVDALAVDAAYRRQGVARTLLRVAEQDAARARAARGSRSTPACTTARPARSMTPTASGEREIRRAPDDRTARALGGPGFVGYLKDVG